MATIPEIRVEAFVKNFQFCGTLSSDAKFYWIEPFEPRQQPELSLLLAAVSRKNPRHFEEIAAIVNSLMFDRFCQSPLNCYLIYSESRLVGHFTLEPSRCAPIIYASLDLIKEELRLDLIAAIWNWAKKLFFLMDKESIKLYGVPIRNTLLSTRAPPHDFFAQKVLQQEGFSENWFLDSPPPFSLHQLLHPIPPNPLVYQVSVEILINSSLCNSILVPTSWCLLLPFSLPPQKNADDKKIPNVYNSSKKETKK